MHRRRPTGGGLRFDASVTQLPHTSSLQQFDLEQTRVCLEADVIPDRLLAYVDEQAAPGGALNRDMTTPDQGVEFGWEHGHWDAQLTVSNGTAGGAVSSDGKQYSSQVSFVESHWRLGVAANRNDQSDGARNAQSLGAQRLYFAELHGFF
jgi:hypothetical protein